MVTPPEITALNNSIQYTNVIILGVNIESKKNISLTGNPFIVTPVKDTLG